MVQSSNLQFLVILLLYCVLYVQSCPTNVDNESNKPYAASCPGTDGWEKQGDFCFWFSDTKETWHGASYKCSKMGAFLAEPKDSKIDGYISGMGKTKDTQYWIGLSDLIEEGKFVWKSSGEQTSYCNWQPGDPNNHKGNEHCALTNWVDKYEQWVDANCGLKKNYVCQAKLGCLSGWHHKGEHCFWFSDETDTWHGAKKACEKLGAILAEPKNAETDTFITNDAVDKGISTWIGLRDSQQEGQFKWASSSEPVKYTNWFRGEPNDANGMEDCVVTNFHKKWNDAPCTKKRHYVCQGTL